MNTDHPLYDLAHRRLLDDLISMIDTTEERTVLFAPGLYCQWASYGEDTGLHIELVSNQYLPKDRQLSPVDIAQLRKYALKGPDDISPNFYWRLPGREFLAVLDLPLAAGWMLQLLVDAYHVPEDVVLTTILLKVPVHPSA